MQDLNQAYRELESKFLDDRDVLRKLIERLSLACRGQATELDNKLSKLCSLLDDNVDLENEKEFIGQLDQLLLEHNKQMDQQLIQAKDTFLASCTRLQKAKGLEPSTRRELRQLVEQIMDPKTVLTHLVPFLESLSRMYSNTLRYLYVQKEFPVEELDQADASPLQNKDELVADLLKVLENFEFNPDIAAKLESQRQRLKEVNSAEALATTCAELMRIIFQAIQDERSGSEQFLSRLNESLERINKALDNTLDASSKLHELQADTESQLREHLAGLSTAVAEGDKLDDLKVQINSRLDTISQLLVKRTQQAELENQLQSSLTQMKDRLTVLEKEARQYQAQLNEQRQKLYIDALTNIPNRASFDERFEAEFDRAKRYNHALTLAVLDVDHFKKINDSFGHTAGDKTLSALGRLLRKWLRRSDFVARYGGEEFVILLPDVPVNQARPLLQKLCDNVAAVPFVYRGQNLTITVSIGAAQANLAETSLDLFEIADKALYQAKNNGRNQVVIAEK